MAKSTTKIGKATVKGATTADKQAISAAKATVARENTTRRAVDTGANAPEAKRTTAEKKAAAEKLFKNADEAAILGLPEGMTVEQRENQVRRGALGY